MPLSIRPILALILISGACSCSSLPLTNTAPPMPEYTGGPKNPEIARKKALLTAEYQELARAESNLKRADASLTASDTRVHGSSGIRATQRGAVAIEKGHVTTHQATIHQLRKELTDAGVVITMHH